ncbi:MAG: dual OB domain-containing protein [Candidatus Anammoxibacter sp.]
MKKRITILAATKRKGDGVCVAGIDQDGSWIRLTRLNGNYLKKNDLFHDNEVIIDTFFEVDFEIEKHAPSPPNNEDYILAENRKPTLIRKIYDDKERYDLLTKYADANVGSIFDGGERSLGLVECSEIIEINTGWDKSGKFYNSISFKDNTGTVYKLLTTDLRWAAFGKHFMKKEGLQNLYLNETDLKKMINHEKVFFSLGLVQETEAKMKELIIGVFTIPDYAECKNFRDLQLMEKSV